MHHPIPRRPRRTAGPAVLVASALAAVACAGCGDGATSSDVTSSDVASSDVASSDVASSDVASSDVAPPASASPAPAPPTAPTIGTAEGTSAPDPTTETTVTTPRPDDPRTTGAAAASTPPAPGASTGDALAAIAVADLARRRDVDAGRIAVVAVEEVTWRDSSLGCPAKGMQYLQVLTPGVRVVLELDGRRSSYHGRSASDLAWCADPQPPVGEPAGG